MGGGHACAVPASVEWLILRNVNEDVYPALAGWCRMDTRLVATVGPRVDANETGALEPAVGPT